MVNHGNIISANCFLVSELRDDCHCVSSACLLLSCSGFNPKCGMNESFFVHILARCDFAFGIQNNTNQYSAAALLGTVMLCSSLRFNVGDHEQDLEEGSNRQAWHFGAISLKASCRRYISIPCPIRMIPAPQFLSVCTCEAVLYQWSSKASLQPESLSASKELLGMSSCGWNRPRLCKTKRRESTAFSSRR